MVSKGEKSVLKFFGRAGRGGMHIRLQKIKLSHQERVVTNYYSRLMISITLFPEQSRASQLVHNKSGRIKLRY